MKPKFDAVLQTNNVADSHQESVLFIYGAVLLDNHNKHIQGLEKKSKDSEKESIKFWFYATINVDVTSKQEYKVNFVTKKIIYL